MQADDNKPAMKRNEAVLNEFYTAESNYRNPYNCKYPLVSTQATQNKMFKQKILVILNLLEAVFVKYM